MQQHKTKRINVIQITSMGLFVLCSGCTSTGYLGNRMRDAGDIFTASVGVGTGAKVRVGPVQVGLMANIDMFGLRGGRYGDVTWYETATRETIAPYPYKMHPFSEKQYPWEYPSFVFGNERYHVGDDHSMVARRGKNYESVSPIPFLTLAGQPEYYTQIEVVIGLLGSLRLGFNPGELVDFILGWTTLDIFNDDLSPIKDHHVPTVSAEDPEK